MSEDYIYQYTLDGFPIARAQDVANRMKFHKIKLYKPCPVCEKNQAVNKPRRKCIDCMLNQYANNTLLTEFTQEKIVV